MPVQVDVVTYVRVAVCVDPFVDAISMFSVTLYIDVGDDSSFEARILLVDLMKFREV